MCNDIIEHSGSTRDQGEASCLLCNGSPAPDHHLHTRHCCSYNVPFLHVFAHIITWKYFSTNIALEDIFHPMVIIFTQFVLPCTAWHYWTSVGHDITVPFMYTCSSFASSVNVCLCVVGSWVGWFLAVGQGTWLGGTSKVGLGKYVVWCAAPCEPARAKWEPEEGSRGRCIILSVGPAPVVEQAEQVCG